jgi:hypothetical protein
LDASVGFIDGPERERGKRHMRLKMLKALTGRDDSLTKWR